MLPSTVVPNFTRLSRTLAHLVCALVLSSTLYACSDDDDSGSGAMCEAAGIAICERACACASDGCTITVANSGASLTFDDQQACEAVYVGLGCMAADNGSIDFATCIAEVDAASCVDAGMDMGVPLPDSCNEDS